MRAAHRGNTIRDSSTAGRVDAYGRHGDGRIEAGAADAGAEQEPVGLSYGLHFPFLLLEFFGFASFFFSSSFLLTRIGRRRNWGGDDVDGEEWGGGGAIYDELEADSHVMEDVDSLQLLWLQIPCITVRSVDWGCRSRMAGQRARHHHRIPGAVHPRQLWCSAA